MMWWERGRRVLSVGIVVAVVAGCASVVKDESTGQFVDDSAITAKVKARLAQEPGVSAFEISVDTYRGVVLLKGFVDREDQREKAISAAKGVPGVREVRGEGLVLRPERRGG